MHRDPELQELLDRSRIADAVQAYCDHADHADVEAILGLFTDDAVLDLGGGALHRGKAELREVFIDRFALYTSTSFHCSGLRLVRYDGTTATTSTYLHAFHESVEQHRQMQIWGRFEDEMVNRSGVWLFQQRHLRVAGLSHAPSVEVPARFSRIERMPPPPQ